MLGFKSATHPHIFLWSTKLLPISNVSGNSLHQNFSQHTSENFVRFLEVANAMGIYVPEKLKSTVCWSWFNESNYPNLIADWNLSVKTWVFLSIDYCFPYLLFCGGEKSQIELLQNHTILLQSVMRFEYPIPVFVTTGVGHYKVQTPKDKKK